MRILTFLVLLIFAGSNAYAQSDAAAISQIEMFQSQLNADYKNPDDSPLPAEEIPHFKGHQFFKVDLKYRVNAKVERLTNQDTVSFPTTAGKFKKYIPYAKLSFKIDDTSNVLYVYQSVALMQQEEYKDFLFLPFTDKTNGFGSYGGGRYIDLRIPSGDYMTIDFNQCYNPYCAYSNAFNCPIPPEVNRLKMAIPAGVMAPAGH
ncbi:MAG TPA: DUF1684 domain-containing protein [Bacteroidia bacterium]|jgi:hypothetical protein|nr:DUF1684 domain-containing protein [Bacteroidia bacterium]HQF27069.1 DUF1684 domain-containing protein [Bacteroidia bacterium]HQK96761.1 DUF1684 domain-containing protein [Bacteroidia bacterium]